MSLYVCLCLDSKKEWYADKNTHNRECVYYLAKDGRICKKEWVEAEQRKWNRHPEQHRYAYPFGKPINREKGENKLSYMKKVGIKGACPY